MNDTTSKETSDKISTGAGASGAVIANRPLRMITFNIAHGRGLSLYQGFSGARRIRKNLDRIAGLIREAAPDLVALQEVDEDSHWNGRQNLLEYLRERSGMEHARISVHNRRPGRRPLAYGNGLLSRYPIVNSVTHPFGKAELGEKGFHYTEILLPGARLPVINLHLDYRSRQRRIVQIEQLTEFLGQRGATLADPACHRLRLAPIVCGDFNSTGKASRDAVTHLFRFLGEHAHYQIWPKDVRTFPAHFPQRAIDFIFIPQSFEVASCQVLRRFMSDHLPVIVDCEIPFNTAATE